MWGYVPSCCPLDIKNSLRRKRTRRRAVSIQAAALGSTGVARANSQAYAIPIATSHPPPSRAGMDFLIGFTGKDYAIIAADANAARSIMVYSQQLDKIRELDSHKLLAVGGDAADCIQALHPSQSPRLATAAASAVWPPALHRSPSIFRKT